MSSLPTPSASDKPRYFVPHAPILEVLAILAKLWSCEVSALCWHTADHRGFTMRELLIYATADHRARVNWSGWSNAELKARPADHLPDGFGMAA